LPKAVYSADDRGQFEFWVGGSASTSSLSAEDILSGAEEIRGAVLEPAAGAHPVEQVARSQADALDGGALRAGWAAAVLARREGVPAAAAACSKGAPVKMPGPHAPTM
jgi:hypothetical protein